MTRRPNLRAAEGEQRRAGLDLVAGMHQIGVATA